MTTGFPMIRPFGLWAYRSGLPLSALRSATMEAPIDSGNRVGKYVLDILALRAAGVNQERGGLGKWVRGQRAGAESRNRAGQGDAEGSLRLPGELVHRDAPLRGLKGREQRTMVRRDVPYGDSVRSTSRPWHTLGCWRREGFLYNRYRRGQGRGAEDPESGNRGHVMRSHGGAKSGRRWLQFSLRGLLVLTVLVALGLGWIASERRKVWLEAPYGDGRVVCRASHANSVAVPDLLWRRRAGSSDV